jgi:hypothetical protein
MTSPKKNAASKAAAPRDERPFTETVEVARGPNTDGLAHQVIAAQAIDETGAPLTSTASED